MPRARSIAVEVDGVRCSLNVKSSLITIGSTAAERRAAGKAFRYDGDAEHATAALLEVQVRARPGVAAVLAARAAAAATEPGGSAGASESPEPAGEGSDALVGRQNPTEVLVPWRPKRSRQEPDFL